MRTTLPVALLIAVAAMLVPGDGALQACPGCSQAVAESGSTGLAAGFNYSIIGLMAMPFLVTGAIGGAIYRAYRRGR